MPLLGSSAGSEAKAKGFDYDCSLTLASNVMFHAAPTRIHKKMVRAVENNKAKIKRTANRRLHTKKGRRPAERGVRRGRGRVDGKKANDAGRWLRGWFRDHFKWPHIDKKSHRIGLACAIGAATGFGFERFYDDRSLRESQHAAIQNCITGAIGVAVFG